MLILNLHCLALFPAAVRPSLMVPSKAVARLQERLSKFQDKTVYYSLLHFVPQIPPSTKVVHRTQTQCRYANTQSLCCNFKIYLNEM